MAKVIGMTKTEELQSALSKFNEKNEFKPGDIIQWKPGMKNKRRPECSEPVVVISVLDKPVFDDEKSAGSSYFNEPLDIVVGLFDSDGDFSAFHYDSRRFEPVSVQPKPTLN